jgi:hypothetical protein
MDWPFQSRGYQRHIFVKIFVYNLFLLRNIYPPSWMQILPGASRSNFHFSRYRAENQSTCGRGWELAKITGKTCEIHTVKFTIEPTKSIVYPYYFDTLSIVWKYAIIMDHQIHYISNKVPYNFHSMSLYGFSIFFLVSIWEVTPPSPLCLPLRGSKLYCPIERNMFIANMNVEHHIQSCFARYSGLNKWLQSPVEL